MSPQVINPFDLQVTGDLWALALVLVVAAVALALVAVAIRDLREARKHGAR